ncbi:UPF0744 protein HuYSC83 [Hanseniaspora uvarum DSM 2768]|nr:UPF0744 protein HuYSC83 [Hanseniaspora uvarum DSM 2768]
MPDNTDSFVKKLIESGKEQIDTATKKEYTSSFDKWIKSPSSKIYDYATGKFYRSPSGDANTYVKNFLDSKEPKENSGSFFVSGIKSSISGTGNILKSSFNYVSSWANSIVRRSSVSVSETNGKIIGASSGTVADKINPAVSYVTDLSKDAYGKAGSAFSASKDYLKGINSDGSLSDGVNAKVNSTFSFISGFSKDLYSKSGNCLSVFKDYLKSIDTDNGLNFKVKSSYSYLKDLSKDVFDKTGSVLTSGKESIVKKSANAISDGKKFTESSEKSLKIGSGAAAGSTAAFAVKDAVVDHVSNPIVESIPKTDVANNAIAVSGQGLLGSDNLVVFDQQSPAVKSSSGLLKGFNYTKYLLASTGSSINQNKLLYSSIILAGLLINETGVRYAKAKANAQYNVLSYQDMNKNIVLVLGSMLDPITKHEVEDLLNRGFIVYVSSVDAKNSPFPEDFLTSNGNDVKLASSLDETNFPKVAHRKNSDILSDISSEDDDRSSVESSYKKISDSDWILSSTQCFSNQNASQDFTRLNYITNKPDDIKSLAKLIKEKNWNLAAIVFSYDNVSNNIRSSSSDFKDIILNNMMEMISTLIKASQIWPKTKIVLFNNSLSKINEITTTKKNNKNQEPSLQVLCNNLVKTVYDTLTQSKHEKVYLINIGILKDAEGHILNYKNLSKKLSKHGKNIGSNLFTEFLNPVQNIIMDITTSGIFYDMSSKNVISCGSLTALNDNLKICLNESIILRLILFSTQFITLSSNYKNLLCKSVTVKCSTVKDFIIKNKN